MTSPEAAPRPSRDAILARIPALLEQHAGRPSWGENDGRLDNVLRAWELDPANFMESLLGWGYTIRIEAEAAAGTALDVERLLGAMYARMPYSGNWTKDARAIAVDIAHEYARLAGVPK